MAPRRPDPALVAAELLRRQSVGRQVSPWDWAFPKQLAYLQDPARFKALFCPRRSAKTYTDGLVLTEGARKNSKYNGLFVGITFDAVRSNFWLPVVCELVDRLGWPADCLNHSRLEVVAPSGGRFRCMGGDATPKEMKKVLGGKFDDVILDEVAAWKNDVRGMVDKDIRPTLTDKLGRLHLTSTPSDLTKGFFYDVTTGAERGWSVHRWLPTDNPHIAEQWKQDHAALLEQNPLIVHTPAYKQMWLGEWCVDADALVYKFSAQRNVVDRLPEGPWNKVLGVDLGWNDPTAFVILAYSDSDPRTYVVHAEAEEHIDFTATAQRIRHLQAKWGIETVVVDGASAQGVEEMIARHGLGLTRADKAGKYDSQKLLSSDFLSERLFLVRNEGVMGLASELEQLIWYDRDMQRIPPKWTEHPRLPNHRADAMLYAWRYTYAHAARPENAKPIIKPEDREHAELFQRALERQDKKTREDMGDPMSLGSDPTEQAHYDSMLGGGDDVFGW